MLKTFLTISYQANKQKRNVYYQRIGNDKNVFQRLILILYKVEYTYSNYNENIKYYLFPEDFF